MFPIASIVSRYTSSVQKFGAAPPPKPQSQPLTAEQAIQELQVYFASKSISARLKAINAETSEGWPCNYIAIQETTGNTKSLVAALQQSIGPDVWEFPMEQGSGIIQFHYKGHEVHIPFSP